MTLEMKLLDAKAEGREEGWREAALALSKMLGCSVEEALRKLFSSDSSAQSMNLENP